MITPINHEYPPPKQLVKYDCETLSFISSHMNKIGSQLISDAHKAYTSAINKASLYFESTFGATFHGQYVEVNIGVDITSKNTKYEKVSYYLMMTNGENIVYRKFHFDYHPEAEDNTHSIFHLQYGGSFTGEFGGKFDKNSYHPWLKEPRIPYKPMSLALLLHLIFINVKDEEFYKICKKPEWRSLVQKNEILLVKKYFGKCLEYFDSANYKLLFDYYCERD